MTVYFSVAHAIKEHDRVLELSGGLPGVKDEGQLESSLAFLEYDAYYPEFIDKLTHLVYSIAMNHCFHDGNKRSSIVLGAYFLEINGYANIVEVFILEMENIVLWVANHFLDKELLKQFICSIVENGGLNEEDKLKLAELLTRVETEKPELIKPKPTGLV
jgi:death-on-curing protein